MDYKHKSNLHSGWNCYGAPFVNQVPNVLRAEKQISAKLLTAAIWISALFFRASEQTNNSRRVLDLLDNAFRASDLIL